MEIMVEVDELGVTWQAFSEAMLLWDEDALLRQVSVYLADHDVFEHFRAHKHVKETGL